jgi:diguanylate cyclase (GGDEF)-like protein
MADDPRAARDLAWAVIAVIVVSVAAASTTLSDSLGSMLRGADRPIGGLVAMMMAIPVAASVFSYRRYRDAAKSRKELDAVASLDSLTGLPNRRALAVWLERSKRFSEASGSQRAVLFIDIDRFKSVNDTFGHDVGDGLLEAVSDRLRNTLRPGDRIVRHGGDEFVLLCHDVLAAPIAIKIAERVLATFAAPFKIQAHEVKLSASVGVALSDGRDRSRDLLADADTAMYEAKGAGGGTCVLFQPRQGRVVRRGDREAELRVALDEEQFVLHYQPVVSLETHQMLGVEALVRWQHPERGLVPPLEFIPALEQVGLIVPVGTWVLNAACRQARTWRDEHPDLPFRVTVNVAAAQLGDPGFVDALDAALTDSGAQASDIWFELTESALLRDIEGAWASLRAAKSRGIRIALDDFGTGYSSLSYIRHFKLDMLKIDKSFVDGLGRNAEDAAIIEHVIGMAHALGMVIVAEGIEDEWQSRELRRLGCDMAQGYWFSRPCEADVISRLLNLADSSDGAGTVPWGAPQAAVPVHAIA